MIKQVKYAVIVTGMFALLANVALAQPIPPIPPIPPWAWAAWPAWHAISPLLVGLGGLAVVALMVRRWRQREPRAGLDILNERFARGEIDKAEYEQKRQLIMND